MMGCSVAKEQPHTTEQISRDKVRTFGPGRSTVSQVHEAAETEQFSVMEGYVPDPRCPLTERQLYTVSKSWKAINRQMSLTAINMFARLFETNGDIQDKFTEFDATQTVSDLRVNQRFEAHALVVICAIDEVISNLDDMDYVTSMLASVSSLHIGKFKDMAADTFWRIEEPFMMAVRETLGDRFTISLELCYQGVIKFILKSLTDNFTDTKNSETPDVHNSGNIANTD